MMLRSDSYNASRAFKRAIESIESTSESKKRSGVMAELATTRQEMPLKDVELVADFRPLGWGGS